MTHPMRVTLEALHPYVQERSSDLLCQALFEFSEELLRENVKYFSALTTIATVESAGVGKIAIEHAFMKATAKQILKEVGDV